MSDDEIQPTRQEINEIAQAVVEEASAESNSSIGPKKMRYQASIYPKGKDLPPTFGAAIKALEMELGCPVWMLLQNEKTGPFSEIGSAVYNGFLNERLAIDQEETIALVIDSPGGLAAAAYKIARLFQRRCKNFYVIVPKWAKSAATLLTLGATQIFMGADAELGPLDVQMFDAEREEFGSALNAVQSLERINAFTMTTVDQMTPLLLRRTGRKLDTLLPLVLKYTVDFVRPLLEKIDTVDYTKRSRELKVAEEYAFRLMKANYDEELAKRIAQHLVDKYPAHGFTIDREEAANLIEPSDSGGCEGGLKIAELSPKLEKCLDDLMVHIDSVTAVGRLVEII